MKCPYCAHLEDKVIDSRLSQEGDTIRRRRECIKCARRYTTYERIDAIPLKVIKRDKKREDFCREKLLNGVLKACEKRPVSVGDIEGIVREIEIEIERNHENEVASTEIGELIMKKLHKLDEVAYVRFASVYRQFKDVNEFVDEIKHMLDKTK
jgi:transcriptional repressor NrdR